MTFTLNRIRIRFGLSLPAALAFLLLSAFIMPGVRAQNPTLPQDEPPQMAKPKPKPTPTPAPPRDDEYEVVRVTSNLVVVPVSVTDAAGQPVLGLKTTDFRLEEEGRTQEITAIGDPEQVPLDIAILLDVSGSVDARFAFEQQAAAGFLKQVLRAGDRATVFAIDEQPRFVQELTSATRASEQLMAITATRGSTAFFDTVLAATRYLEKSSGPGRRKVIVVISDGDDTARILSISREKSKDSELEIIGENPQIRLTRRAVAEVQTEVQRAEITFYSINPSGNTMHLNVRTARSQQGMERIAEATGGAAFVPARLEDLNPLFDRIAAELRSQYLLQYYSNNESQSSRYLRIKVGVPAQAQLRIRARQGYYPKSSK